MRRLLALILTTLAFSMAIVAFSPSADACFYGFNCLPYYGNDGEQQSNTQSSNSTSTTLRPDKPNQSSSSSPSSSSSSSSSSVLSGSTLRCTRGNFYSATSCFRLLERKYVCQYYRYSFGRLVCGAYRVTYTQSSTIIGTCWQRSGGTIRSVPMRNCVIARVV